MEGPITNEITQSFRKNFFKKKKVGCAMGQFNAANAVLMGGSAWQIACELTKLTQVFCDQIVFSMFWRIGKLLSKYAMWTM